MLFFSFSRDFVLEFSGLFFDLYITQRDFVLVVSRVVVEKCVVVREKD